MALTEDEAAKVLLIRSVEECDKNVFPTELLTSAVREAGTSLQGTTWFLNRASYLFGHLPAAYRSIIHLAELPSSWSFPICLLAVIAGFGTNLLGPAGKIHVVYNPALLLVMWNLLVFSALVLVHLAQKKVHFAGFGFRRTPTGVSRAQSSGMDGPMRPQPEIPWLLGFLLPGIWRWAHRLSFRYWQTKVFADTAERFWSYWTTVAGHLMVAKWKRLLHYGAASLAIGATAGMYFRGLFQGYEVVWTSTFIRSEEAVSTWVNAIFSPAFFLSWLMGLDLQRKVNIAQLVAPEGDPAAPWIHLFAITVFFVVVVPRAGLAAWQSARIRRLRKDLPLLFDRYYGDLIESPIRSLIEEEVRKGVGRFVESVASFVQTDLYDRQIVPKLEQFRERGGRIAELRSEIKNAAEAFAPEVRTFVSERGAPEFQRSVAVGIEGIFREIGTDFLGLKPSEDLLAQIRIENPETSARAIGYGYGDTISAAIAASIAVALGTISGGFGAELETAIIVVLLGTTGPIGFVIGALIGLLAAGAGWYWGRDKIAEFIEIMSLPATVVRVTLWESRFRQLVENGRKECHDSIKAKVEEEMEPLIPRVTEDVLLGIRRLWAV